MLRPDGRFPDCEQQADDEDGRQQSAFRAIIPAAPEWQEIPSIVIPRYLDCKPAQVDPEQRQDQIPAEMQADGQPEIAAAQEGYAQDDAPEDGVDDSEHGG